MHVPLWDSPWQHNASSSCPFHLATTTHSHHSSSAAHMNMHCERRRSCPPPTHTRTVGGATAAQINMHCEQRRCSCQLQMGLQEHVKTDQDSGCSAMGYRTGDGLQGVQNPGPKKGLGVCRFTCTTTKVHAAQVYCCQPACSCCPDFTSHASTEGWYQHRTMVRALIFFAWANSRACVSFQQGAP